MKRKIGDNQVSRYQQICRTAKAMNRSSLAR